MFDTKPLSRHPLCEACPIIANLTVPHDQKNTTNSHTLMKFKQYIITQVLKVIIFKTM